MYFALLSQEMLQAWANSTQSQDLRGRVQFSSSFRHAKNGTGPLVLGDRMVAIPTQTPEALGAIASHPR